MLRFQPLQAEEIGELAPYFRAQNTHISDFSLGFQAMWRRALRPEFAYAGGCLVLREFYAGKHYFHYPLCVSGDPEAEKSALDEIESYCRNEGMRLHYTNVPKDRLPLLFDRYDDCFVNNRRRWRDYLYRAETFLSFAGKKYSGQRNHIHRFLKTYPIWQFRAYTPQDEPAVRAFLEEYAEAYGKDDPLAREEFEETVALLPRIGEFGLFAGMLEAEGRLAGFSVGERCGDMMIVHIEKALKEFEGVYPMLAQQFARAFCADGVRFFNRMDDAGDGGLRKSKLQYGPCRLVDKFNVQPRRAIDSLPHIPEFATERLTVRPFADEDAAALYRLAYDRARNRYWGYDWRQDLPAGEPDEAYFLREAREDFRRREEVPFGMYRDGVLAGELVLHRFGYRNEAELGVRLLPEYEGMGLAAEGMRALAEYAFLKLGIERAEAKHYHENVRSERMLRAAGFLPCGRDETFTYYYKTPEM